MAFDLGELLKNVSEPDTGREQIEYIKLDLIDGDDKNFYELSDLENLANNIATIGLQQPLRVRVHPDAEGRYMVVSGHRRRAALTMLAEEDPQRWNEVACIVDRDAVSPALQQLRLIFGNSGTRKMSSADQNEQAAQVEKLLYQLKEEGYEFPGRMRDHVAEVVQLSKTKLAKLKVIRDNLAACWQQAYKDDILGESSAYELSRMPTEQQILLFEEKQRTKANIKYLYADDIKKFAERAAAIVKMQCKDGGDCTNRENKMRKAAVADRYYGCRCGSVCCRDCPELLRCQRACPRLAEIIGKMKADAKNAAKREKEMQAAKDRPVTDQISALWQRFGLCREMAFKDIDDCKKAMNLCQFPFDYEKTMELECGEAKIDPTTKLPYGYHVNLIEIKRIIDLADLFGCSIDYLLCRTDVREVAQEQPAEKVPEADTTQPIPGAWYPPSVEPPINARIIIIDKDGYADSSKYRGGENPLDAYCIASWPEVRLWSLTPEEVEK